MNAIEIKNLTKNFGYKKALSGLNMTVPQGAIYGFIGENGSGKSTTEKIICGLILPSGGSVKLFGKDYTDTDIRARIGVLIEAPGCFQNYSVWNNMMLQAMNAAVYDDTRAYAAEREYYERDPLSGWRYCFKHGTGSCKQFDIEKDKSGLTKNAK